MTLWDGVDEFVAVGLAGSFAAAAEALGMSTSHVSRAVARLESRVQAQLFYRTTRTVRLTDTGQVMFGQCRRLVQERNEAFALVGEEGRPHGELHVTCSTALGERFVAPIIREYCEEFPQLTVHLELTSRVVDIVAEGFDLAIRTGQLPDSRLVGMRIASRRLYCTATPEYLERAGRPLKPAELSHHDCLIGSTPTWHFKMGGREHLVRPKGRWRCNSGFAVVDAALAGMGVCQLPDFYVVPHIISGRLEVVLDEFRPDDEPIWAIYPQQRHLLPKVRQLVERLRSKLPERLGTVRMDRNIDYFGTDPTVMPTLIGM